MTRICAHLTIIVVARGLGLVRKMHSNKTGSAIRHVEPLTTLQSLCLVLLGQRETLTLLRISAGTRLGNDASGVNGRTELLDIHRDRV
jgi:hypothetical protein